MKSRILLIQLRQSGDVLMTTPAVRAIRGAFPEAHLAFLTEPPSDQIYLHSPHIDEVILWRRRDSARGRLRHALALRREGYDVVVDFFSNPTSAMITRLTGAPRRLGYSLRGRKWMYTQHIPLEGLHPYAGARKMALAELLGAPPGGVLPEVFLHPSDRAYAAGQLAALGVKEQDLLVVISPVSRRDTRVWPAPNYARLADTLIERHGAKVLFQWGPGETAFVDAVRAEMRLEALPDYPVPSILQMAAMMEKADLFIGNNNGPRHFAIAVGTPTVGVFGRLFPESWSPPAEPMHRTVQRDPGCKNSCHYPRCGRECIRDVPYEEVERTVDALIEEMQKNGKSV